MMNDEKNGGGSSFKEACYTFKKTYLPGGGVGACTVKPCSRLFFFLPPLAFAGAYVLSMWINGWMLGASGGGGIALTVINLVIGLFYAVFGAIRILVHKADVKFMITATAVCFILVMMICVISLADSALSGTDAAYLFDYIVCGVLPLIACVVLTIINLRKRTFKLCAICVGLIILAAISSTDLGLGIFSSYSVATCILSVASVFMIMFCSLLILKKTGKVAGIIGFIFAILYMLMALFSCLTGGEAWAVVAYIVETILSVVIIKFVR